MGHTDVSNFSSSDFYRFASHLFSKDIFFLELIFLDCDGGVGVCGRVGGGESVRRSDEAAAPAVASGAR